MDQVLGQAQAVEVLQAALSGGRLHHAYIFHGPPGVGKCTTAMAFARLLLCHDRQQELTGRIAACGACPSCQLSRENHPDLHLINKERAAFCSDADIRKRKQLSIPTEVLREFLLDPVYRSAKLQHGKVFIIDEAELIRPDVQNTLLKTLEEPPAGTYLILVTTQEDNLLPTIRSRCQRVAFVPLGDDVLEGYLQQHATALDARQRQWLADFAAGSMGRVQLALQYELWTWAQTLLTALEQLARGQFPAGLGADMARLIDDFAKRWVEDHPGASKDAANRQAAGLMLSLLTRHAARQLHHLAARCSADDPDAAQALLDPWLAVIDTVAQSERYLASNVNLGLVTDHLASRLGQCLAPTGQAA